MRLASSSRAVRCRRLPIAYRLLVARSDVVAARQARSQSPRGSPRRSRWAGPLGRKGRSSAFRYLLKHLSEEKLTFWVGAGYWAGIAALPGKSIWAGLGPSGAARRLPAHRPPRPLGVGWPRAASGVRAKNQLFLAPTWTGEGGGKRLIRCRPAPPPRSLPAPPALPCQRPDRRLAAVRIWRSTRPEKEQEQEKKDTGQEPEQKRQNTPFPAVLLFLVCRRFAQYGTPPGRPAPAPAHLSHHRHVRSRSDGLKRPEPTPGPPGLPF